MLQVNFCAKTNETITNFVQNCKFNPESTCGPIWPEVVVLEPCQSGHHASIKKFVDLTSSVSDLISIKRRYQKFPKFSKFSKFSRFQRSILKKYHTPEPSTGGVSSSFIIHHSSFIVQLRRQFRQEHFYHF